MSHSTEMKPQKILVLATNSCAYPGADAAGQAHMSYPENVYVLRVPSPVIFPESFYLRCFDKGIGGIIVMSCGEECPYLGAYERLAARLDRLSLELKQRGINPKRLKLTAICTVCTKAFLRELADMKALLATELEAAA